MTGDLAVLVVEVEQRLSRLVGHQRPEGIHHRVREPPGSIGELVAFRRVQPVRHVGEAHRLAGVVRHTQRNSHRAPAVPVLVTRGRHSGPLIGGDVGTEHKRKAVDVERLTLRNRLGGVKSADVGGEGTDAALRVIHNLEAHRRLAAQQVVELHRVGSRPTVGQVDLAGGAAVHRDVAGVADVVGIPARQAGQLRTVGAVRLAVHVADHAAQLAEVDGRHGNGDHEVAVEIARHVVDHQPLPISALDVELHLEALELKKAGVRRFLAGSGVGVLDTEEGAAAGKPCERSTAQGHQARAKHAATVHGHTLCFALVIHQGVLAFRYQVGNGKRAPTD